MRQWNEASVFKKGHMDYFCIGESLSDLPIPNSSVSYHSEQWAGATYEEALRFTNQGNPALVARSDKIMAEIETNMPELLTSKHENINDVIGAVPDVSRYLSGEPNSMKRRRKTQSNDRPIAVVVTAAMNARVTVEEALNRGAAILALIRVLSAQRPIGLYGFDCNGDSQQRLRGGAYYLWRVETAPLELSRAAWEIGHPAVLRQLFIGGIYTKYHKDNGHGYWPYDDSSMGTNPRNVKIVIKHMAPELPDDILIIPGMLNNDPLLHNPVEWVLQRIMETRGDLS